MRHQFFKTARFYAVYGSGGFSVGGVKSSENSFVWAPSLFTHQLQAKPCRCSRRVAPTIERINLGYDRNLMRVLISLTAALAMDS